MSEHEHGWVVQQDRLQAMPPRIDLEPFLHRVRAMARKGGRALDSTKKYIVYSLRAGYSKLPSFYIGKGEDEGRPWDHIWERKRSIKANIIRKALRSDEGLYIEILFRGLAEDVAFALEMFLIAHFGRRDLRTGILSNLTDGGEGTSGWVPSKLTRSRIGDANRGKEHSTATRKRMSSVQKGKTRTQQHLESLRAGYRAMREDSVRVKELRETMRKVQNRPEVKEAKASKRRTPEEKIKLHGSILNPLFNLVQAHIKPHVSLVQCRYCSGLTEVATKRFIKGRLPSHHYACAEEVFRMSGGSRVYGMNVRGSPPQILIDIPDQTVTYRIVAKGIIFYEQNGKELDRTPLPEVYTRHRLEGDRTLRNIICS